MIRVKHMILWHIMYQKQSSNCFVHSNGHRNKMTIILKCVVHMSFRIDVLELHWNQDTFMKIISWNKYTNTAFMQTSPTYDSAIDFNQQFLSDIDQSQIKHAYACKSTNILHLDDIREMNLLFQNQNTQDRNSS